MNDAERKVVAEIQSILRYSTHPYDDKIAVSKIIDAYTRDLEAAHETEKREAVANAIASMADHVSETFKCSCGYKWPTGGSSRTRWREHIQALAELKRKPPVTGQEGQ